MIGEGENRSSPMQPFDDPASEERRAIRARERGARKAIRRIQQGLYATDTSPQWTRLSRSICERRWIQAIRHYERTLPAQRWNGAGRKKPEWPLAWRWPGQKIWSKMRGPQEKRGAPAGDEVRRPAEQAGQVGSPPPTCGWMKALLGCVCC